MKKREVQLPVQTRGPGDDGSLCLRAESVNEEDRTVELVWTTGSSVKRRGYMPDGLDYGPWIEELSLEDGAVDTSRMDAGAPLLNNHSRWDLGDVLGVVEAGSVRFENGKGICTVRFSEREEADVIFQDVKAGIIRNVSVGYTIEKFEVTREEGKTPIFRAVSWTPSEVSLVPIGADPEAGVRSADKTTPCEIYENGEDDMAKADQKQTLAARAAGTVEDPQVTPVPENNAEQRSEFVAPVHVNLDADEIRRAAAAEVAKRSGEIRGLVRDAGLDSEYADELIGADMTVDGARAAIFDKMVAKNKAEQVRSAHVQGESGDDPSVMRERMAEALAVRHNGQEPSEQARIYAGTTIVGMAEELLGARGENVRHMRDKNEIIARAMDTTDFPILLQSAGNRILMPAYEGVPSTFKSIAKQVNVSDFRSLDLVRDGDFPELMEIQENGEFKQGSMSEGSESIKLKTVGRKIRITRQMMVNDNLGAFANPLIKAAQAAARYENKAGWDVVINNANMSDGKALFHADHGNLAGAGAISATTIGAGKKAIRTQKNADGNGLNYTPSIIAVPAALETIVEQYLSQVVLPTKPSDVVPASHKQLEPVIEPLLDADSVSAWYLFTNPQMMAAIVYSYLEGAEGPQMVEREVSKAMGAEFDVYLDFAAAAVDHRGAYKNG